MKTVVPSDNLSLGFVAPSVLCPYIKGTPSHVALACASGSLSLSLALALSSLFAAWLSFFLFLFLSLSLSLFLFLSCSRELPRARPLSAARLFRPIGLSPHIGSPPLVPSRLASPLASPRLIPVWPRLLHIQIRV